jgi:hypothetical protein
MRDVVSGGYYCQFRTEFRADLAKVDCAHQPIADAFASLRIGKCSSFSEKMFNRFAGTAVSHASVCFTIELTEITKVANAVSSLVKIEFRERASQTKDLKGKSCG